MSFLRAAVIRSSPSTIFSRTATRAVRRTTSQPSLRIGQQNGRRGYASATDAVKKTSDLPWAVSAVIGTTIGLYIALSPSEGAGSHGHDDHGDHGKGHDEHEEEPKEEESKDDSEAEASDEDSEKSEPKEGEGDDKPKKEEKSDEKEEKKEKEPKEDDKNEEKKEDKPKSEEKSKDGTNADEDAGTKGDTQKGATKNKDDIKHREEDSGKGATKVRMDSPAGKTIGEGSSSGDGDAMAKTQKGISNTDTRHSTDPSQDPGKSKKGEGTVETAKIKGTVDPSRPQV